MSERDSHSVFRHLVIRGAKPPPSEAQIEAIERLLGAQLPSSFRDFLHVANGGYLEYVVDVPTGDGETEQMSFCGIFSAGGGPRSMETFVGEIRAAREHAKAPRGVLPFARDGGGSVVYLDLSPEGGGRVVAFVTGLPPWAGKRTESALLELAPSFDAYVAMLRLDREAVLDHLEHDTSEIVQLEDAERYLDLALPDWRSDEELGAAVAAARARLARSR